MSGNTNTGLRAKIDEIKSIIQGWGPLPANPAELVDTEPFFMQAILIKIGDQMKVRVDTDDFNITFEDLIGDEGRIGVTMEYLNHMKQRLPVFKAMLEEVAMDPSDTAVVMEEIARNRGDQELNKIPGWNGPSAVKSRFQWEKQIGKTFLKIAYFRDTITENYVTEGLFVPFPPQSQWLIKDGRRYEWQVREQDRDRLFREGFVDTDFGTGEVIDKDVSTPPRMARYLENLANSSTSAPKRRQN